VLLPIFMDLFAASIERSFGFALPRGWCPTDLDPVRRAHHLFSRRREIERTPQAAFRDFWRNMSSASEVSSPTPPSGRRWSSPAPSCPLLEAGDIEIRGARLGFRWNAEDEAVDERARRAGHHVLVRDEGFAGLEHQIPSASSKAPTCRSPAALTVKMKRPARSSTKWLAISQVPLTPVLPSLRRSNTTTIARSPA